ncbi:hypothetical protein SDC9_142738 [bioreactor metagenome]|uniref:Uncharacterized protein n=1 Tax=bioreactor metagenome TaxID=1076179 RepID=A0A645E450_9ZZZZ
MRATQRVHLCVAQSAHRNVVAGVGAHLKHAASKAAVQQLCTIERSGLGHAIHFVAQLLEFGLQCLTITLAVGGITGLHGQFSHALQHVSYLAQGPFGCLGQRDSIIGIARCDGQTADLGAHAFGNGQASRIVLGAVDTQTRRQALHGGRQRVARQPQIALCIDGHNIGVNGHCHLSSPFS